MQEISFDTLAEMEYTIEEHRHRFAAWAAARAAQRNFTNTKNILSAIDCTNLRQVVEDRTSWPKTSLDFDKLHGAWCNKIISKLSNVGVKCPYGRVAKIVAIYLKSSIILAGHENSTFGKIIHPPIDRILLTALGIKLNWTSLDKKSYFKLVNELRPTNPNIPFWQIEKDWKAV